jgi:NAD(P)-dependent dehydrogenase (short-subunit alcohol dehydrogenase family)
MALERNKIRRIEGKMDYGLKGKVALVTGTASQVGMGNAICLVLAKEGCDIVSTDIDLEGAKKTAAAVKGLGRKAIALKANIAKSSEVDEMVKVALKEFSKIDILVNTAGLTAMAGKPFLESKQETWEKDLAVNLYGTMNCAKAVIPSMVERKYGKIINFSSIVAKLGVDLSSYSAAKAGVSAFTRALATQYGPSGINVNAIAPGMVKTKFFEEFGEEPVTQMFAGVASMAPLRRNQTAEDIANAVAFLASDVSRNITGQVLQVDSGLVML